MNTQLNEETDDEYLDDPIKLFDFEQERVHYGSQIKELGDISTRQLRENLTAVGETETNNSSDNDLIELNEIDCIPSYVKLVDCGKFPWYFKKYSQQILEKTSVFDLISDNESEINVPQASDSDSDCLVVDDLMDELGNTCIEDTPSLFQVNKTAAEKRYETMKRNNDIVKQKALSQQNVDEVDFRRNKGLVGMVIGHKIVKNTEQANAVYVIKNRKSTTKPSYTLGDKNYIKAADKILSNIGTDLIPISEDSGHTIEQNIPVLNKDNKVRNEKKEKRPDELNYELPVSLRKISEEIVRRIKKTSDKQLGKVKITHVSCRLKTNSNTPKPSSSLHKAKNSSHHIKNIMKTNKYKNRQEKRLTKMLTDYLETQSIQKEVKNNDQMRAKVDVYYDQSSNKTVEEQSEPRSPILPCNSLSKKNKIARIEDSHNKDTTINKTDNINEVVNKSEAFNKNEVNNHAPKQIISEQTKTKTHRPSKKNFLKKPNVSHDTNLNLEVMASITKPNMNVQLETNVHSNKFQLSPTSLANETAVIQNASQPCSNNRPIQILAVNNISIPIKLSNGRESLPDKVTSTPNGVNFQNKSVIVKNHRNKITHFENDTASKGSDNSLNKTNNVSVPMYNPRASSVIIRPNYPFKSPGKSFGRPILSDPRDSSIPVQMTPRFYENPYLPNYQHRGDNPGYIPRSANCTMTNYRFPAPPYANEHQSQYKLTQFKPKPKDSLQSNSFPKKAIRDRAVKIFPVTIMQPQGVSKTKATSQANNVVQVNKTIPPNPTSRPDIIGTNNEGLENINNVDPRILAQHNKEETAKLDTAKTPQKSCDNTDLVTSKTKMLEVLECATNDLKRSMHEDDSLKAKDVVSSFKRPKLLSLTTVESERVCKQVEQHAGYSPPILPIPTYEKVLDRVIAKLHLENKNRSKNHSERRITKNPKISVRNGDIKKTISLEEYKKRMSNVGNKSRDSNEGGNKNNSKKPPNINKQGENVDRLSTESDLGYDSDSTVIL